MATMTSANEIFLQFNRSERGLAGYRLRAVRRTESAVAASTVSFLPLRGNLRTRTGMASVEAQGGGRGAIRDSRTHR